MSGWQNDSSVRPAPALRLSSTFLVLVVAFLVCAVWMLYRPDHARLLVFPLVLSGFLIALCLHEFGHAIVAYFCGDTSVREKGYLTLDPLRYTDVQYSIVFPVLVMAIGGIGLPGGAVYINTNLLRRRLYGALVSLGGPLATALVLAGLMAVINIVFKPAPPDPVLYAALSFLAMLEVTALLFNLIPCPGLDGWGILEPFLPTAIREQGRRFAPLAPVILLLALFFVPGLNQWFWDTIYRACMLVGLEPRVAWFGYGLFQFWR